MKIKYLNELIRYYKEFGLKANKYQVSISNYNGKLEIVKHPDNNITEEDILNSVRIKHVPNCPYGIIVNLRKVDSSGQMNGRK